MTVEAANKGNPVLRKPLNWQLIILLSMIGIMMGFATVYWIPSGIELVIWFVLFDFCAYIIIKRSSGRYFLHGFLVGIFYSAWVTVIQIAFLTRYLASHPEEAAIMSTMPISDSPRLLMLLTGIVVGATTGFILGIFALLASKFVKKPSDMIRIF